MTRFPHDIIRGIGCTVGAVIVGAASWSGPPAAVGIAALLPTLWAYAPGRLAAGLVSLAYTLSMSTEIPAGIANYLQLDLLVGGIIWLVAGLPYALLMAALWRPRRNGLQAIMYAIALLLFSVPPLGFLCSGHPITAAGILLPGWGWIGLAAMAAGLMVMTTRAWPVGAVAFCGLILKAAYVFEPPVPPAGWIGINTQSSFYGDALLDLYDRHVELLRITAPYIDGGEKTLVLPENSFGFWLDPVPKLWKRRLENTATRVLAGATVVKPQRLESVVVEVGPDGERVVYHQRMPIPFFMWKPWSAEGFPARPFGASTFETGGYRVAPLICYEELLIWPVLQSLWHDPDVILAMSNNWWGSRNGILVVQRLHVMAWASLFELPLVTSQNATMGLIDRP